MYQGGIFEIEHINDDILKIEMRSESLIEQEHLYQKIKGFGLPKNQEERGDLLIRYIIEFPKFDQENLEKLKELTQQKETLISSDEENKLKAENCPYEEVYFVE